MTRRRNGSPAMASIYSKFGLCTVFSASLCLIETNPRGSGVPLFGLLMHTRLVEAPTSSDTRKRRGRSGNKYVSGPSKWHETRKALGINGKPWIAQDKSRVISQHFLTRQIVSEFNRIKFCLISVSSLSFKRR